MTNVKCKNCGFWDPVTDNAGRCHRRAPLVVMRGSMGNYMDTEALWPSTLADEWCGEFEPSEETLDRVAQEEDEERKELKARYNKWKREQSLG